MEDAQEEVEDEAEDEEPMEEEQEVEELQAASPEAAPAPTPPEPVAAPAGVVHNAHGGSTASSFHFPCLPAPIRQTVHDAVPFEHLTRSERGNVLHVGYVFEPETFFSQGADYFCLELVRWVHVRFSCSARAPSACAPCSRARGSGGGGR